jgi:hypothetical protein
MKGGRRFLLYKTYERENIELGFIKIIFILFVKPWMI